MTEQKKKIAEASKKQKVKQFEKNKAKILEMVKSGKSLYGLKKWHTAKFERPTTLTLKKKPAYPKFAVPKSHKLDEFAILKRPHNSETAMAEIEGRNTLVFITHLRASKKQIAKAFQKLHSHKPQAVRTLITTRGEKKAFIRLPKEVNAVDLAGKIGLI